MEEEQPVSFFFLLFLSFLFLSFSLFFSCSSFLSLLLISTELIFGSWWRISSQTTLTCVTHANLSSTILPCMRVSCHLASLMCQVSFPLVPHGMCPHAKCHHMIRPLASKYVKFRLSRNSTKFDCVPRFRETNSTAWSVSSSKI